MLTGRDLYLEQGEKCTLVPKSFTCLPSFSLIVSQTVNLAENVHETRIPSLMKVFLAVVNVG
jgi:hypothetical protein